MKKSADIPMHPVKSSNLAECGHCHKTNTLAVKFRNGSTYHYHGVDEKKFKEMMAADSIGRHLNTVIRKNHKHTKVVK